MGIKDNNFIDLLFKLTVSDETFVYGSYSEDLFQNT